MAEKKFYYDIDLVQNSIINAKLHPVTTAQRLALIVGVEDEGLVVYDKSEDTLYMWNGSLWIKILDSSSPTDLNYVHIQNISSDTWNVTHNLGKYPSVTVVDSANSEVEGEVEHLNLNSLILRFTAPFSGKAFIN